jgi:PhoPQ-activated pathogenicity-related protein
MVIDILNINANVRHHWEAYGLYTDAISDYVDFDLFCRMDSPEGQDVVRVIDPWLYVNDNPSAYSKRKMLLKATGDQFFLP